MEKHELVDINGNKTGKILTHVEARDPNNVPDGYYIVKFLKAQNIDKIDYFILTHCDEDHIGGAYKILDEIQIGTLYMPNKENDTQTYERLLNAIERNNVLL